MSKPEEYGICIRLVRQDDAELYEGRVTELPDLKVYSETYSEAYEELLDAIETAQTLFAEQSREFPQAEPAEESFSGRVTLRMSRSLHRCVHEKAARDSVSLNQWIVEAIGCRITPPAANQVVDPVFVISQIRQRNTNSVGICIQHATHLDTTSTQVGFGKFFTVPGVIEASPVNVALGHTKWSTL